MDVVDLWFNDGYDRSFSFDAQQLSGENDELVLVADRESFQGIGEMTNLKDCKYGEDPRHDDGRFVFATMTNM
jgi:hypothetical protein